MDPSFRAGLSPRNVHAPIYFPPPPKSTTTVPETKKAVKLNFSKPRPSTETTSSTSSVQPPATSILKRQITSTKRPRQWILLSLLITSFTILILSMIFAYCAALPHSDNIQAAQAALQNANTTLKHRDTLSSNFNQTVNDALAQDIANASKFNQPSALAALTFYTATLPLLTMLHTSTELLTSLIRPQTSQSTRLGDALRFRQQAAQNALTKRRISTLLSFTVSALLCLGWLIMQMFWLNCEITLFSAHSEGVCPVQIQGHRMGGVSELSIGKVALAFVVILGYAGYCMYLVRWVGVFGSKRADGAATRTASFRRRARFERRAGDAAAARGEERNVDGSVETVVIGIDVEKGLK